jgi:membrane-associated protein
VECGILLGLILPGDSLLFIVGLLLASGFIKTPLVVAIVAMSVSAIAGNLLGYWLGAKAGPALFRRPDSKIFKQEYVDKTHGFFDKYGSRSIILARFVPIVRSLITGLAGVGRMEYKTFAIYSAVGGILWVTSMTLAGYYLGNITFIKEHIDLVAMGIVLLSVLPIAFEILRRNRAA